MRSGATTPCFLIKEPSDQNRGVRERDERSESAALRSRGHASDLSGRARPRARP